MPARKRRWVRNVKTVSTFPREGTFTEDAKNVARMGSKKAARRASDRAFA